MKHEILVGRKIGKFEILHMEKIFKGGRNRNFYYILCECGRMFKTISDTVVHDSLKCQCQDKRTTHKDSRSRLYVIWCDMKKRCNKENCPSYKNYGGKGVKVFEHWNSSYENFKKWALENGYKENLTIDRIDWNGNYEPSNCRWISISEQQKNKDWDSIGKRKRKWILQINPLDNSIICEHHGINETQKKMKINNIHKAIKENKIAGGFKWKYKGE